MWHSSGILLWATYNISQTTFMIACSRPTLAPTIQRQFAMKECTMQVQVITYAYSKEWKSRFYHKFFSIHFKNSLKNREFLRILKML